MNIPAEFDEIRPYTPEELPQIYEELIADPAFPGSGRVCYAGHPLSKALADEDASMPDKPGVPKSILSTDYYGIW